MCLKITFGDLNFNVLVRCSLRTFFLGLLEAAFENAEFILRDHSWVPVLRGTVFGGNNEKPVYCSCSRFSVPWMICSYHAKSKKCALRLLINVLEKHC